MRKLMTTGIIILFIMMSFASMQVNVSAEEEESLIEIIDKRDTWSKTYDNGNGQYIAEISSNPMHFFEQQSGQYEDIDTTIIEQDSDTYVNLDNIIQSEFPKTSGEFIKVTNKETEHTMKFRTLEMGFYGDDTYTQTQSIQSSQAEVVGNVINYSGVFSGITEQYIVLNGFVKRNFILDSIINSPDNAEYMQFMIEYYIGTLDVYAGDELKESDFSTSDMIEVRDPTTYKTVFILVGGTAYDSVGNNTSMVFDVNFVSEDALRLIINVPVDWLENAQYPVTVDPQTTVISPYYQGSILYYHYYAQYYTYSNCYIGSYKSSYYWWYHGIYRSYWRWNTANIPDSATITNIDFSSNRYKPSSCSSFYYHLRQMNNDPQSSSIQTIFTDAGDGDSYAYEQFSYGYYVSIYISDLGSTANTDLQNKLGSNWFAIGAHSTSEYESGYRYGWLSNTCIYVTYETAPNQPPVADAGGPYEVDEGSPVTLDASGSSDPDEDILQYRWDFDNNGIWDTPFSTSPTASHTWTNDYYGTVKVEVTDGQDTDTDTAAITVNNVAPVVNAGGPYVVEEGTTVLFDASGSSDPGEDVLQYRWDFETNGVWDTGWSTSPTTDYTWYDDYTCTVTVEVSDGEYTDTDTSTVTVNNVDPVVDAGMDQGQTVYLRADRTVIRLTHDGTEILRLPYENLGISSSVGGNLGGLTLNPLDGTLWVWKMQSGTTSVAHLSADGEEILTNWMVSLYVKDIVVDPADGCLFLCADYDRYTYKYNADGTLLYKLTSLASYPHWLASVSPNPAEQTVWMTDYHDGKVLKLKSSDGSELLRLGGFGNPGGISVDQTDGSVWVTDYTNNQAIKLDTNGNELVKVGIDTEPWWINANYADGGAWVGFFGGTVKRLDSSGNIISQGPDLTIWSGFDINPDGTVWVTEREAHKIHKLSPSGELLLTIGGDPDTHYAPCFVNAFPRTIVHEGDTVSFDGDFYDPGTGDTHTTEWDFGDGSATVTGTLTPNHAYGDNGVYEATLTVTDDDGGVGTDTTIISVENLAPTINSIEGPTDPVNINDPTVITGHFTDPGTLDTHTASIDWGDETSSSATVSETNGAGTATASHFYSVPGVYSILLTVTDDDGDGSSMEYSMYIVVYDPEGGFVTGGGWIDSPEGAYVPDQTLTGKASFGFVSKYKKGASEPVGNTEFHFKAADMNFHSSDYDWLVIAGAKAQFKGTGTINGEGNYGFMLTAVDGELNGGGGYDKFRIKIWDKDNSDNLVYDNQLDLPDDGSLTTLLGGGSIKIHKS
jgi:PKD repeat protein